MLHDNINTVHRTTIKIQDSRLVLFFHYCNGYKEGPIIIWLLDNLSHFNLQNFFLKNLPEFQLVALLWTYPCKWLLVLKSILADKMVYYLKLGLEHKFGVLKSGSLFSDPNTSFLGDSWMKLNFWWNDFMPLGESVSIKSTHDWTEPALLLSGVLRLF